MLKWLWVIVILINSFKYKSSILLTESSTSPDHIVKLQKQIDKSVVEMRLSSQTINAAVGDIPTRGMPNVNFFHVESIL